MNRIKFLFLLFFFNAVCLAYAQNQTVLIEYKYTNGVINKKETLIANNNQSIYIKDSFTFKNDDNITKSYDDNGDSKITINQQIISLESSKLYSSQKSDIIFYTSKVDGKMYLVKDSLPTLKWNLNSTDTKLIDKIICQKATTSFRGSQIVAWYSKEIPISFGPWKFRGLPGTILELYNLDAIGTEKWSVSKIIYPYIDQSINFSFDKALPLISHKEIINSMEADIQERIRKTQSRAPAGVRNSKTTINRVGIEKIYEWETEHEEKK